MLLSGVKRRFHRRPPRDPTRSEAVVRKHRDQDVIAACARFLLWLAPGFRQRGKPYCADSRCGTHPRRSCARAQAPAGGRCAPIRRHRSGRKRRTGRPGEVHATDCLVEHVAGEGLGGERVVGEVGVGDGEERVALGAVLNFGEDRLTRSEYDPPDPNSLRQAKNHHVHPTVGAHDFTISRPRPRPSPCP